MVCTWAKFTTAIDCAERNGPHHSPRVMMYPRMNGCRDTCNGSWRTTLTTCTSSTARPWFAIATMEGLAKLTCWLAWFLMVCDQVGKLLTAEWSLPQLRPSHSEEWASSSAVSAGMTVPRQVWSLSQEEIIQSFCKLFPYEWFVGFTFPFIEDLINTDVFTGYLRWRDQHGLEWDGPLGPMDAPRQVRLRQRMAEGQQAGALSHKAAVPPILSYGLLMDEHFAQAQHLLQVLTPAEAVPLLDDDLQYAACCVANESTSMQKSRKQAVGVLKELKRRWGGVTSPSPAFSTRHNPESDSPEGYRTSGSSHCPDVVA